MQSIESKEYPFVSIVIPVKNEEKYIGNCLGTVINLDYPKDKYEIIVVDNDSSDKTKDIVKKIEDVILLEKRDGTIGSVRNFGAKYAKGDILAFLDGDCVPNSQWLKKAINTMSTVENSVAVGSTLTSEEGKSQYWVEEYWLNYLNSKYNQDIQYVDTISSFCFVVKRKTMEDIGGFNEKLITCEDSDLGYRISQAGGKILVKKDIKIIHLGNAKNSWEFFQRQLWHGKSNLISFLSHRFEFKELHSVVIPLIYLISIVSLPLTFLFKQFHALKWILIFFLVSLPIVITIRTQVGRDKKHFLGYLYLWFLYLSARGLGMLLKITHWKA